MWQKNALRILIGCGAMIVEFDVVRAQGVFDIVEQGFPESLASQSRMAARHGGPEPVRFHDHIESDLDGSGVIDDIVAVYGNGFDGHVRVWHRDGADVSVVDSDSSWDIGGIDPTIKTVDVDGDGNSEILVSSSPFGGRNPKDFEWLFRWNSGQLSILGPVETIAGGLTRSLLANSTFADINGDGIQEILVPGGGAEDDGEKPTIFQIGASGTYRAVQGANGALAYFSHYFRGTTRVSLQDDVFGATPGTYTLRVLNGTGKAERRLRSGSIRLNGSVVVQPCGFGRDISRIDIPVTLGASNSIVVEMRGRPGTTLLLMLEKYP